MCGHWWINWEFFKGAYIIYLIAWSWTVLLYFFWKMFAAWRKSVIVPMWIWHQKGFVIQSPVGMNCCRLQQEALLFSSRGSSMFGALYMLDLFLVHWSRVKLKHAHPQLLTPTQRVCQLVVVCLLPLLLEGKWEGRSLCCAKANPAHFACLKKARCSPTTWV